MGRLSFALLASALALAVAGCGSSETRSTAPETVEGTPPAETAPAEGGTDTAPAENGGEETQGDPAAGAEIYSSAGCGSCHTLAEAGSAGTIGPNLDDSQPAFDLVVDRVTNGMGAMPAFGGQLSEEEILNVAAYVVQATSG